MTPTTITRADEGWKLAARMAEAVEQLLAILQGESGTGDTYWETDPRYMNAVRARTVYGATLAARSTDDASDDMAIVSAAAKYHWLSRFDHLSWVNELLNEVRFNTLNSAVEYAMEYEKRAARAASGSGEAGK